MSRLDRIWDENEWDDLVGTAQPVRSGTFNKIPGSAFQLSVDRIVEICADGKPHACSVFGPPGPIIEELHQRLPTWTISYTPPQPDEGAGLGRLELTPNEIKGTVAYFYNCDEHGIIGVEVFDV